MSELPTRPCETCEGDGVIVQRVGLQWTNVECLECGGFGYVWNTDSRPELTTDMNDMTWPAATGANIQVTGMIPLTEEERWGLEKRRAGGPHATRAQVKEEWRRHYVDHLTQLVLIFDTEEAHRAINTLAEHFAEEIVTHFAEAVKRLTGADLP